MSAISSPISCHTSRMLQWNLQATSRWRRRTRFSGLLGFGWLLGLCGLITRWFNLKSILINILMKK